MSSLELIKEQIQSFYRANQEIRVNVSLNTPKLSLTNAKVKITGVYPHIFQIEEYESGKPRRHTLQYTDILIKHIVIL